MNEDMEVDDEIFQLQKERLRRHLPFVKRMLEKVRNTTFEKKWQQMYTCIMSDRKRLTMLQIDKMDQTIISLETKMDDLDKCAIKTAEANLLSANSSDSLQTVPPPMLQSPPPALPSKPVSLFFAKAPELSNPPLSMDEIGDLLEENGGDDLSHINKEINEVKRSVEENKIKKAPEMEARKVLQSEGVAHYRYTCMAARSELNLNKPKTLLLTDAQKAEALYRRTMQTHGPQAVTTPALAASSGSSTAAMRFMQSPPPTKTNVDHKNFPQKPEVSIANPAELLAKMKQRMNDQKAKAAREREKERAASNSTSSNPNKKSPAVSHSNKALNSSNPLKSSTLNFKIPKLNRTSLDLTRNDKTMHSSSSPAPSSSKPSQNNSQEEPKASSASLVELQDSLKKKLDAQLTKTRLMSNVVKKTQNVVVSKKRARHSSQKLKDSSDEDNVSEPKKKIQARVAPNNHKAQVEKPKEHKNSVEKKEEVEEKSTFDEKVLKQFFSKLSSPQNCDADEKNKLLGMLQNVVGGELSNKILKIIETKDDPSTSSAVSTHDEDSCDSYKKTESTKATKSEKIIKKPAKTVKRPRDETVLKEESKEPETDLLKPLPVKKSKRHKNELDRLNEDILNMFIRDDVLTASGRRICSAYKSTEQNSSKGRDKTPIRAIKSSLNYPPNLSLSQRRQLDQKFEIIVPDLNLTEDDMPVSARLYMENAKIKQEPITPKVLGKSNGTARKRTMPEKPFTRTRKSLIKKIVECENNEQDLADDEKTLEDVKSVVKCKKSASKRRYAWNKGIIRKKRSVPHKTGDMEEMEEETKPEKKTEAVLKNTNITIHAKNPEYTIQCCLCDFSFQKEDTTHLEMVQHFVLMHEDHEIFVSRLSPEDAKSIKESPMKITGSSIQGSKITFRCLLCPHPSEKCMQPTAWINHIGLHTGEYCFKCTQCDIRVADWKDLKVAQHLTGCKQAFFETVIEKSFLDRHLTGYLCDECNYVQINEKNLKKHVEMEHDGNDVKIIQISLCNYSDTRTSITPKSQKEETKYVNVVKKMSPTPSTSTANSIVEACDTNDDWEDMDDGEEWEDMDSDENQNNTKQKAASILEMINEESDKMKSKKKGVKSKGKKSSPHKKATPTKMSNQKSSKDAPENVQKADPNTQKLQEIAIDPPMPELTLKIASVQGGQRVNPNLVYQQCNRTGFAIENNNIAYKCFIAGCVVGCQFENNQRDKFLTHLKTVHKLELWNGYCRLCKKQVTCDKSNRIFEEVKHVEMIHIASGLIEETNTNFKDEKIQIRLKKLPGDNLSGNSDTLNMNTSIGLDFPEFCDDEPPASIITKPTRLVVKPAAPINRVELLGQHLQEAFLQSRPAVIPYQKPAVHIARPLLSPQNSKVNVRTVNVNPVASTSRLSMGTVETKPEAPRNKVVAYLPNTPHLQNNQMDRTVYVSNSDDSADYHHNLNPWIPNYKCRKPDEVRRRMLHYLALCCTFKCMASTCSYYTTSSELFFEHLQCHLRLHPEDSEYFNCCAYCTFSAVDHNNLIGHVLKEHRFNRFQCPYCFYRACVATHVLTHFDAHHKGKKVVILETTLPVRSEVMSMQMIMTGRNENVPSIVCVFCKAKFFVTRSFLSHLRFHDDSVETKCIKCKEIATKQDLNKHMIRCHGYGLYQCVYCKFGTNSIDNIRLHLSDLHFDHLPYACERSPGFNSGPIVDHNSVDSIQLLRLDLEVEADCIHKKDYPQNDTKNQENVLKMADTKQVRRLITTPRIITQTVQNTRAVQPGEQPQRTIQAQKILQANRETGAVQSFVLPKNTTIRTVPGQNVQGKIVPHPNDPSKRILIHPMLPPKNPAVTRPGVKTNLVVNKPTLLVKNLNAMKQIKTATGQTLQISEVFSSAKIMQKSGPFTKSSPMMQTLKTLSPKASIEPVRQIKIDAIVDSMVKDSGVDESVLYICGIVNCSILNKSSMKFFQHLQTHKAQNFPCAHCKKLFSSEVDVTNHYNDEHLLKRFFCYFCYHKESNRKKLSEHMSRVHKISATNQWPFNPKKNNGLTDAFALCPESVTGDQFKKFLETLIQYDDHRRKLSLPKEKTVFNHNELDLLPNTPIFGTALSCDSCSFSTKVRLNLYRHLKQHTEETEHAGDTKADTNGEQLVEYESDADETVSSAVPSNTQELKTTKLVPINERYKCNAKGCHYLSLDSDMFQSHLRTLHSKEVDFACPHCQSVICQGKMNVGLILAHLTLHGEKLFKCSFCSYYDSSAYAMKTHCKLHVAEEDVEIVTVETIRNDRSSIREQRVIPVALEVAEPWKCEICNVTAPSRGEIIQHMVSIHQFRTQFKCNHCPVRSNSVKYFEKHFEMTHPDVYNLKVISMFSPVSGQKLIENVASVSTQPLWMRDESKTKSIRGILFEEEASGSTSASPTNASKSTSPKVVEANDAAPVSSVYSGAGSGEVRFGCEHCNKPFPDMQRLIKHWDIQHKNQIMVAQANELQNRPGKPFRFILQKLHGQDGPVDFLTDAFFARTFASTKFILECGVCHFKTCMGLELDAHFASKHNMTNTINNSSRIVKPLALRVSADATLTFECHYRTKTTLCKYSSSDVKVFAKHWRDHVAHHLYGCTYCTRTADTLAHLMEHCKEQHPNEYAESSNSNRKFGFKKLEVSHPEMQRSLQETKVVLVNGLVLSLRELDKTAYNPTKVITNEIEAICAEEFRKFQQLQLQQQNKKSQILGDDSDNEDEDALVIDEDPRPETSNTEEPNLLISNEVLDVEDDLLQPMDEPALSNVDSCATEQQEIDFNKVYMILEEENITYNNFVKAYDSDPVVVIKEQCEDPIIQSNEESSGSDKTTTPEPVDPHLLIEDEKVITNLDNTEPEQLNVAINPLLTTVPIISAVHSSFEHMEIDSLYVG